MKEAVSPIRRKLVLLEGVLLLLPVQLEGLATGGAGIEGNKASLKRETIGEFPIM